MKKGRWYSCNVLQIDAESRRVWHFQTSGSAASLASDQALPAGQPLPARTVAKDWTHLLRKRLNIAWLPPEHVFLRVAHLPPASPTELASMIELQLEKLSPLPATQIVWSFELLPLQPGAQQTVVVLIAARDVVEEFLGRLEGQGYQADRLEAPSLHELIVSPPGGNTVSLHVSHSHGHTCCLAAWWMDGELRHLNLLHVPATPEGLRHVARQLTQVAWAGEMEGWLIGTPDWRLVADRTTTAAWEPLLREELGQGIQAVEAIDTPLVAALAARRATTDQSRANLMPREFITRYRQLYVDRLWMRALGAVVAAYLLYIGYRFIEIELASHRVAQLKQDVIRVGRDYTNTLMIQAQIEILEDQLGLKYAALDCWNAVSERLPTELTLTSFTFRNGQELILVGATTTDQASKVTDFTEAMSKAPQNAHATNRLFSRVDTPTMGTVGVGPSQSLKWEFKCELNLKE